MKIITTCLDCGYTPAKLIIQTDGQAEPEAGNFWLCSMCGLIHVYRHVQGVQGVLVALAPSVAELFVAAHHVPEMLAMAQEIRERGPRPLLAQDNGGKLS